VDVNKNLIPRKAVKLYIISIILGLATSAAIVFAAVKNGDVLTAELINSILTRVTQLESQTGTSPTPTLTPTQALTGKVSVVQFGIEVNGTDTAFLSELEIGDAISIQNEIHKIVSIDSDILLRLDTGHSVGGTGVAFTDGNLLTLKNSVGVEKMSVDKSGHISNRVARAIGNGPSFLTKGSPRSDLVPGRALTINKRNTNTSLRISYTDYFGIYAPSNGHGCNWEVQIDGLSCTNGPLKFNLYSALREWDKRTSTLQGYCEGVDAGVRTITVLQTVEVPNANATNCLVDDNAWMLEAKEVY